MIHLEEYLDTLEALPMELQRQFTLMRELDALSQDIQDQMKQSTEEFINNPPTKEDPKHAEYLRSFSQLFSTVLKHGEEKVALATQTYDLVDKHIRRLDDDLAKFEERQLAVPRIPHRWGPGGTNPTNTMMMSSSVALGGRQQTTELGDDAAADRADQRRATSSSAAGARRGAGDKDDTPGAAGSSTRKKRAHRDTSPPPQANGKASTPSSRRGRGGGGGAQATTATAGAGTSSTATPSVSSTAARGGSSGGAGPSAAIAGGSVTDSAGSRTRGTATATKTIPQVFADMPIDPNEPRYCYCQQVSYGEMVACDDEDCKIEWFHLDCVDLKAPPKGQWFCDDCSSKHNKKHRDRHHHHHA